jgi:hypothetical protein
MSIRFSPIAAVCTAIVLGGFAAIASAELRYGLFGFGTIEREGVLPIERGGVPRSDRQRDILGAVLLHEASRPGRRNVCLKLAAEGHTFEQEKRAIGALQQRLREQPAARAELTAQLDQLRNPRRAWLEPRSGAVEEVPLPEPEAQQLRTAETSLLGVAEIGRIDLALDDSNVPAEFRSTDATCNILYFTAPVVAGEIAFVETDHRCGANCRDGSLYALVWDEERWVVEGLARTWTP